MVHGKRRRRDNMVIDKVNCKCDKETEITEIHTIVKRLDKKLTGNGQKGLITEFNEFKGIFKASLWLSGTLITILGIVIGLIIKFG